jgi:hypothetical protein
MRHSRPGGCDQILAGLRVGRILANRMDAR